MRRVAILCLLVLAACSEESPPAEPVLLYAHEGAQAVGIETLLSRFTSETGIPVTLHYDQSAALTDDVINKRGSPQADVLLTSNAADIWRAADAGALRPIQGGTEEVQDILRDPDGLWVAAMVRTPMIVVANGASFGGLESYDDLGRESMAGRLCLGTSTLPAYRALVAMMIEVHGTKPAERMIRRWVRNLALPPFTNDKDLLDAIARGDCEIGLVASGANLGGLQTFGFRAPYFDIDGLGVGRHASHPDAAQRLVKWLIGEQKIAVNADHFTLNAGVVGYREEEARLLAERAGYR